MLVSIDNTSQIFYYSEYRKLIYAVAFIHESFDVYIIKRLIQFNYVLESIVVEITKTLGKEINPLAALQGKIA